MARMLPAFTALILTMLWTGAAFAQAAGITVDNVAENVVKSSENLPGLITASSYALGILLGVLGVLKLKDHVENASQTPLRTPMIRLIAGGALFALPIVYESMVTAYNAGAPTDFDPDQFSFGGLVSGLLGALGGILGGISSDVNALLGNMIRGMEKLPGIITALSYVLGLVCGVAGILKIKDHVESPDQTPMREGVVRFLAGGALFALPTVYEAMAGFIAGPQGVGIMGQISSGLGVLSWFSSAYTGTIGILGGLCSPIGTSLGDAVCGVILRSGAAPAFLSALSYLFGLVMGVWGILKIRDHALNPQQTAVWEGFSRLIAGGAFFALPVVVESIRATVTPAALSALNVAGTVTGYNEDASNGCNGLDGALYCFMADMLGPIHNIMNFFTFVAGIIFIMIGISRLIKSAQEGAKAPGGLGTFMTFVTGGALISYNEFVRAFTATLFTSSFFGAPVTRTYAELAYTTGMTAEEVQHAHTVISAVLKFMIVVGLISFVRGIFIVRGVAEGNGQASIMAGVTHMVGGALAVNLGPLINAVQSTLGLTGYGITFT